MPARYSRYIPIISLIGDFFLLNLMFVAGFCLLTDGVVCFEPHNLLFYVYINLVWLALVITFGAHRVQRNTGKKRILFTYIRIIVFFFFFFLMYFQATSMSYYPRDYIKYLFPIFFAALVIWKFALYYAFILYRRWGYNFRNVVIIGYTEGTRELARYFRNNPWHGYRLLGFFDEGVSDAKPDYLGSIAQMSDYCQHHHVDEVYIAMGSVSEASMPYINDMVVSYPMKIRIVPNMGDFSFKSTELLQYGSTPVIKVHRGPLSYWYNRMIKRAFDVTMSVFVILFVLSWMIPLVYALSAFSGRGGLFFRQQRTRIDGEVFTCIKFRTMRPNSLADHKAATIKDDRTTPLGRFLRKFSLDELPQFFNVLLGDMSVVGPRPHMLKHTEEYRKLVRQFMVRHTVKPGITGLAQVNGYRGEVKCEKDIAERVRFDVQYIENWTFNLDLKIILITVWLILRGRLVGY